MKLLAGCQKLLRLRLVDKTLDFQIFCFYHLLMVKKYFVLLSAIVTVALINSSTSYAVWNGEDAKSNTRTVAIYSAEPGVVSPVAFSGFLYSPNIVFTVAHGFYGDDRFDDPILKNGLYSVGYPGDAAKAIAKRVLVKKYFLASDFISRNMFQVNGNRISRKNDFAVLVLSESLPVDSRKVELLTPEMHDRFIESGEQISITGYGFQNKEMELNSNSIERDLPRFPKTLQMSMAGKQVPLDTLQDTFPLDFYPGRKFIYDQTLNVKLATGSKSTICSGDSGSPFYLESGDKITYLGAVSSGIGSANCGSMAWSNGGGYGSGDPVYLFSGLIQQAENYLKIMNNPVVTKKKTITCLKGKIVKKVSGNTPRCPAGYKQQ